MKYFSKDLKIYSKQKYQKLTQFINFLKKFKRMNRKV